ncbi:MAG TPA: OB-fold domain-containing protein [Solirubrobacteraceae bacterium]|nr:OB-fold domain-containing protein [Solirubrobacteraceae bacterium]
MSFGLLAYGAYIPRHRLQRAELGAALGTRAGNGARTVAGYDEDTTSMGVEAARRALERGGCPDSIYFATTAPAYFDKTNATAIHAALDLGHRGFAVDLAGAARSAVGALRAAATTGGLAVLADIRTGRPGSSDERDSGDAAAAFLFGEGRGDAEFEPPEGWRGTAPPREPLAVLVGQAAATAEFLDRWRTPGRAASQAWEERFGLESYLPLIRDAARRALDRAELEQADRVVISSPHARSAAAAAKEFPGRIETPVPAIGYAGAADLGVKLAAVLDVAEPDETVLLIHAADGCDAVVLRTTAALRDGRAAEPVAQQLDGARDVGYATFLSWRGMIERETPRRPEPDRPAGPPSARSEAWKFAFVGSRCTECGRVHVPPTRVCSGCRAVDKMERAPLSKQPGTVATYTVDKLAYSPSPPMIDVVVDFDGGGRYTLELTDASPDEVEIGSRVETTFRRLYTTGDVHNYFWKVRPARNGF